MSDLFESLIKFDTLLFLETIACCGLQQARRSEENFRSWAAFLARFHRRAKIPFSPLKLESERRSGCKPIQETQRIFLSILLLSITEICRRWKLCC